MPTLYSKDRKSLQFPTNCDAYLRVPYTAVHQNIGIWGHSGSFTFQTIITPYDVNGNSAVAFNGTEKSLSQQTRGLDYMTEADRYASDMVLFYNTNIKVSLDNTTTSSSNQPAEYAIKFSLTVDSTTTVLTSDTVIFSSIVEDSSLDPTNYRYDNHTPTQKYSGGAWGNIPKDALYLEVPHHIAVAYNSLTGRMDIYYDGSLVKTGQHSAGGNFVMAESDITIGQQPDASTQNEKRRSQFMGELHEMTFTSSYSTGIGSTNTLTPFFGNVLLYFDFEEANVDGV